MISNLFSRPLVDPELRLLAELLLLSYSALSLVPLPDSSISQSSKFSYHLPLSHTIQRGQLFGIHGVLYQ